MLVVRSDLRWVVMGAEKTRVRLVASGKGQVQEALPHLKSDQLAFLYLRVDQGPRSKFVFVTWQGDDVPLAMKRLTVLHKNRVKDVYKIVATDLVASSPQELLDELKSLE